MSEAGGFKVWVSLHAVDHVSKTLMHVSNLAGQAGKNVASVNKQIQLMGGLAAVMIGSVAVGAMVKFGSESTEAAMKVERLKLQMQGLGASVREVAEASQSVTKLSHVYQNLRITEGLHHYKDLRAIFGNHKQAMQMLPVMSKFGIGLKGLYGDKADGMGWDAARAAELQMGHGSWNPDKMTQYLDSYMRVMWMTGGKITPSDIHALMKNTPYRRLSQDPTALANMAVLIQEMGGSRAGTSFQAMDRALIGKQFRNGISKEKLELWQQYGLINHVKRNASGKISDFDLKNMDSYQRDVVGWIFNTMGPALAAHGIDITSPKSIPKIAPLWSTQTAGGAMIATGIQKLAVDRHKLMYGQAFGIDAAAEKFSKSPPGRMDAYNASMENLKVAMGATLLPLLTKLVTALTPVINTLRTLIEQHPRVARFLFVIGLMAGAFVAVAGAALVVVTLFATAIPAAAAGTVATVLGAVTALGVAAAALITNPGGILGAVNSLLQAITRGISGAAKTILGSIIALAGATHFNPQMAKFGSAMTASGMNEMGILPKPTAIVPSHQTASGTFHSGGNTFNQTLHINIHGMKDPKEASNAFYNEVDRAIRNLINPKQGYGLTKSPYGMHGYAAD